MNATLFPATGMHQMIVDASVFLSHITPSTALAALIAVAVAFWFMTREKSALAVALSAALYLAPLTLHGSWWA